MTKKLAVILSLIAAAAFQTCRPGRAPVQAVDAVELEPELPEDAQDPGGAVDDVGTAPSDAAGEGEAVEAPLPPDEAKAAEQGKKKKKKEDADSGKCKHVQCFDLCCDKGQVCAHTHGGGGDGPFPASHKCITPPK